MKYIRALALAALAGTTIVTAGCAVIRGQEPPAPTSTTLPSPPR